MIKEEGDRYDGEYSVKNPYMEILGRAIRLAVDDFANKPIINGKTSPHFDSACFYLFSPEGLKDFIPACGMNEVIEIDPIREYAINLIKVHRKFKIELASSISKKDYTHLIKRGDS